MGKDYECDKCDKIFNRKGNLRRHLRVHQSKVENFVCNICSKSFANKGNLKLHFDNFHNGLQMQFPKLALVPNKGYIYTTFLSFSMNLFSNSNSY